MVTISYKLSTGEEFSYTSPRTFEAVLASNTGPMWDIVEDVRDSCWTSVEVDYLPCLYITYNKRLQ